MENEPLQKLAKSGDINAKIEVAYRHIYDEIKPFDAKFVYETFKEGIEKKAPRSNTGMGYCYQYGIMVEGDDTTAYQHYQKAADEKDPLGCYSCATFLLNGWGKAPIDPEKAMEYLTYAANEGVLQAKIKLISMELSKPNLTKEETVHCLKKIKALSSDRHGVHAITWLGNYYDLQNRSGKHFDLNGKQLNPKQRQKLARKYFLQGAEKGHPRAIYLYTKSLLGLHKPKTGRKPKKPNMKDRKTAAIWLRKLTKTGYGAYAARAHYHLGEMQKRTPSLALKGESWYQHFLDGAKGGNISCLVALMDMNRQAPGYTFRDLDWSKTLKFGQEIIDRANRYNPSKNRYIYDTEHRAIHQMCAVYYKGGLGAKRDYKKCLQTGQPLLGTCEIVTAYAGRILLHENAPMGNTREHFIRGYACMLRAKELGYEISENTLFIMRSRHGLSREEVEKANKLVKNGFPNKDTNLLP